MALMSGSDAALIANAVYRIQSATTDARATQLAQRRGTLNPPTTQPAISENVTALAGMVGSSGAFVKETTGFGMVLERGPSSNRELIVSIRGTQTTSDWLSNFNIGFEPGPSGSIVHAGFNRIYKSLQGELSRVISNANPTKIHFCGHSLGGALATLAAVDFAGGRRIPSYLYTFGAPRVGSFGLLQTLRTCLPFDQVRRVYALSDPVPMIPLLPFMHFGTGSAGISAGYQSITPDAHSMDKTYIPRMPATGWPPIRAMPNKSDPDYWLDQADKASGWGSSLGYWCLGKALEAMMDKLNVLGFGLSVGMTVLDRIIQAMEHAVRLVASIGETVIRWVKTAMRMVGMAVSATFSAAQVTREFLRYVLDLLMQPVIIAAKSAVNKLV